MADHDTHDHTGVPGVGGSSDLDAIITASAGQDIADALAGAAAPDAGNVFATMADVGGGGGVTFVGLEISADFNTGSGSTWTDVTGLTGISLTAGTYVAFVDLETGAGVTFAPVFRVSDGTTIYAQSGHLHNTPGATVSNRCSFQSSPFVLVGSATMKLQYFSDTVFTIKKYPVRGGDTSVIASRLQFMKIA